MTPKPPPGLERRAERRLTTEDLAYIRREWTPPRRPHHEHIATGHVEALLAEVAALKTERDSYREQVKALLEKVAAVQKCDHGGET